MFIIIRKWVRTLSYFLYTIYGYTNQAYIEKFTFSKTKKLFIQYISINFYTNISIEVYGYSSDLWSNNKDQQLKNEDHCWYAKCNSFKP